MKKFIVEMDEDELCCCRQLYDRECQLVETSIFECKGSLKNRPDWCPLIPTEDYAIIHRKYFKEKTK